MIKSTLKWILKETGSQCSEAKIDVMGEKRFLLVNSLAAEF